MCFSPLAVAIASGPRMILMEGGTASAPPTRVLFSFVNKYLLPSGGGIGTDVFRNTLVLYIWQIKPHQHFSTSQKIQYNIAIQFSSIQFRISQLLNCFVKAKPCQHGFTSSLQEDKFKNSYKTNERRDNINHQSQVLNELKLEQNQAPTLV